MARPARYYPEARPNVYTGFPQLHTRCLADHVDLAEGFLYPACTLPVFGKERGSIGHDFDDITGFMGIGASTLKKMAKFIRRYVAIPVSGSTDPDTGFRLTIGTLMQDNPRCV